MHEHRVTVGLGLGTAATPIAPPAPRRFSTTKGCPNCSPRRWLTVRAMMSVALPAVKGTMTRTGLLGHVCASAAVWARHTARANAHVQERAILLAPSALDRHDLVQQTRPS